MKKLLSAALVLAMGVTALTGCNVAAQGEDQPTTQPVSATTVASTDQALKAPKYVFLFIGDGMSYPRSSPPATSWAPSTTRTTGRPPQPGRQPGRHPGRSRVPEFHELRGRRLRRHL